MVNTPMEIVQVVQGRILNMNTLRAGIHHIEFWVANLEESISFMICYFL